MAHELIWESQGLYKRFYDRFSGTEYMSSVAEGQEDPRFPALRYVIHDFLGVTELAMGDLSFVDVILAELGAQQKNGSLNVAIVTTNEVLILLSSVYLETPSLVRTLEIFPDLSAARDWLDAW